MKILYNDLTKLIEETLLKNNLEQTLRFSIFEDIFLADNRFDVEKWLIEMPFDNINEVFGHGEFCFISDRGDYESKIYENPTWENVICEAQKMITINKQYDHVFLENAKVVRSVGEVYYCNMQFGS